MAHPEQRSAFCWRCLLQTVEQKMLHNPHLADDKSVWMRIRGHGWRHGFEMSFAMLVPWAVLLAGSKVIPALASISDWAMYLGMLAYMLVRREHYTGGAHHDHARLGTRLKLRGPGAFGTLAGVFRRA
jgi:hypothetical protein